MCIAINILILWVCHYKCLMLSSYQFFTFWILTVHSYVSHVTVTIYISLQAKNVKLDKLDQKNHTVAAEQQTFQKSALGSSSSVLYKCEATQGTDFKTEKYYRN